MTKLTLGTVQFGLDYGVANTSGQVNENEVKEILSLAKKNGIACLDTAINYGDSEKHLGRVGIHDWDVITKLPEINLEHSDVYFLVNELISRSLSLLNVSSIYGLLLHKPLQLLETNGFKLWSALVKLKKRGIVKKIGFSVYMPEELEKLWDIGFIPDIVQAPFNVFDQRLKDSGWLSVLHNNKVEVHTRSVFLQGLLLMSESERPKYFSKWNNIFEQWDQWLIDNNQSGLEAALNFVFLEKMIDKIIIGVDSKSQLKEIVSTKRSHSLVVSNFLKSEDSKLINPSYWNIN